LTLAGLRVLVTRAVEDAPELEALLRERGAAPVRMPCIAFEDGPDVARIAAVVRSGRPDLIVVSSPQGARRLRHRPFLQAAVGSRVRPVALADDDDAVGARHAAEAGRAGAVGQLEAAEDGGLVHLAMIAMRRPPGKCQAAHTSDVVGPSGYQ